MDTRFQPIWLVIFRSVIVGSLKSIKKKTYEANKHRSIGNKVTELKKIMEEREKGMAKGKGTSKKPKAKGEATVGRKRQIEELTDAVDIDIDDGEGLLPHNNSIQI